MEQDNSMEKANDVNDDNAYVSHYPDSRRYSMANAMATNRPQYRVDNQGYSVNTTQEADDNHEGSKDTKIDMPSSQPPMYSAVADKLSDKKVKVRNFYNFFILFFYLKFFIIKIIFEMDEIFLSLLRSLPSFFKNYLPNIKYDKNSNKLLQISYSFDRKNSLKIKTKFSCKKKLFW